MDQVTFKVSIPFSDDTATVTLREGEYFHTSYGGPTEEGYHRHQVTYTYRDGHIYQSAEYDSRDCDGRYTGESEKIAAPPQDGGWPVFREVSYEHRDHSAEAAGY